MDKDLNPGSVFSLRDVKLLQDVAEYLDNAIQTAIEQGERE
jgi:hypothetical protein